MGLMGGGALGGLGTAAAGAIGGGTLTGGLLAGLGKAAGTYAISEGIDTLGREGFDKGGDIEDIDISKYAFGSKKAERLAKGDIESMISGSDKGQITSALLSGTLGAFDTIGGIDAIKNRSKEFGKYITGGGKGGMFNPGTANISKSAMGQELVSEYATSPEMMVDTGDMLKTGLQTPKFTPQMATEGASPLNFLTGEGAQANLLDTLPSYSPQGTSIMDSLTQFPQEITDYFANNPDMTVEEKEEILAMFGGQ